MTERTEYEEQECDECFHPRFMHDPRYGCDHEHDTYIRDVAEAVRCGCDHFVELKCDACGTDALPWERCPNSPGGIHVWIEVSN